MVIVFDLLSRVVGFLCMPFATFWSIQTLAPYIVIPYTLQTFCAFWLLFVIVRWVVQNIRHGDWSDIFSIE